MEPQTRYDLHKTGIWGEVVRQRKPVVVNDFGASNPLKKGYPTGHVRLKNFMSIPVFKEERIVAVIGLGNKNGDYDDNDVYEMTMLMNGIWMAVEQKESQRQVENLLAQTRSMFNEHEAVMLLIEPETGRIIDANPAALNYYGYSRDELCGMRLRDLNMLSGEEVEQHMADVLDEKRHYFTAPHRMKNGEIRMVDIYSCPISYNSSTVLYSIMFDVTEREKAFDNIRYISCHDYLTGLYNRRHFDEALARMNDASFMPLTVIMADINGLKLVNDSFGHEEGDRLLVEAARIIREGCGENDVVARIGGDEFAILLPNTDDQRAHQVMKRIKTLEANTRMDPLVMSLSMGYAVKQSSDTEMIKTLSEAENYMYRRKMYESASIRSKTIEIVMNTLFEKSRREMEHSGRVGNISSDIAAAMGLDSGDINQVQMAGTLHDIGKIGIDEKILNKPGLLDENEWQELKKHAEAGWRILSNSDEFSEVADFILHHHEQWDGRGYPEGLKGEDIPLQSRIISVADAFDAMTQDRPYRKTVSKQEARRELEKNVGVQFDPAVVETFIEKVYPNI
jgi:diguanylate cyclase (GGDEF)-like protein/PAS domain S-box-containing protein/putative nucleotidyltransferase with HDIG domain